MAATLSALDRDAALYWLALRLTPGLGTRTAVQLLNSFRTPQAIFQASPGELESAGLPPNLARTVASGAAFEEAVTQFQKLAEVGAELLPIADPRYPARLREIYDPPVVLFARGNVGLLDSVAVAMVGTRRPTPYGVQAASRLARDLAAAGVTIVSGMARGIDTAAHRGALDREGNTIAVFGCGVDQVYPAENRRLAAEIAEKGLIVSDFPMATPPYPQNFPLRNRIVSGISAGVLIVEGGEHSGSSITAKLALMQGREVLAVPGNITSKMSWGPNLLIKQGAKLVQEWGDVVAELDPESRRRILDARRKQLNLEENDQPASPQSVVASLETEAARAIWAELKFDVPTGLDNLIEALPGRSTPEIITALFELEIAGLVRQLPGKCFLKVWEG